MTVINEQQVEEFFKNNKLVIGEHTFDEEALTPVVQFQDLKKEKHDIKGQFDYAVILNMNISEDLINARIAREVVSRIQKIRQKEKFNINDKIVITYDFANAESKTLKALEQKIENVKGTLLKYIEKYDKNTTYNFLTEQEVEIDDEKFFIRISTNVLLPIHDKLKADFPESHQLITRALGLTAPQGQTELNFTVGGKAVKLQKDVHFKSAY